jgi:polyphosphate kinase
LLNKKISIKPGKNPGRNGRAKSLHQNSKKLTEKQKEFVRKYFDEEVESNVIPILLHDNVPLPYLREKVFIWALPCEEKIGNTPQNLPL